MSNVYEFILEKRSNTEVLAAAAVTSQMELENCAARLEQQDVIKVGDYVETNCKATGVQRVLIFGGLLELFALSSREAHHPELFEGMCQRLGIGRSLGFEFRQVWRTFGKLFHDQPELPRYFVAEALKILARESTPKQAVQAAIERAQQAKPVDISFANNLREHALRKKRARQAEVDEARESSPVVGPKSSLLNKAWRRSGKFFRVALKKNASPKDRAELINELELILNELKRSEKISIGNQHYV